MEERSPKSNLKLIKETGLNLMHDEIFASLERPEKAGINKLLANNNKLFKKVLYTYLVANQYKDIPDLMATLDKLLEVHAKECYTIGYLDSLKS